MGRQASSSLLMDEDIDAELGQLSPDRTDRQRLLMRQADAVYRRGVPLAQAERKTARLANEGSSPPLSPQRSTLNLFLESSCHAEVAQRDGVSRDTRVTWAKYDELLRDTMLPRGVAGHSTESRNGDRGALPTAAVIASREESDKIFSELRALKVADMQQFQRRRAYGAGLKRGAQEQERRRLASDAQRRTMERQQADYEVITALKVSPAARKPVLGVGAARWLMEQARAANAAGVLSAGVLQGSSGRPGSGLSRPSSSASLARKGRPQSGAPALHGSSSAPRCDARRPEPHGHCPSDGGSGSCAQGSSAALATAMVDASITAALAGVEAELGAAQAETRPELLGGGSARPQHSHRSQSSIGSARLQSSQSSVLSRRTDASSRRPSSAAPSCGRAPMPLVRGASPLAACRTRARSRTLEIRRALPRHRPPPAALTPRRPALVAQPKSRTRSPSACASSAMPLSPSGRLAASSAGRTAGRTARLVALRADRDLAR